MELSSASGDHVKTPSPLPTVDRVCSYYTGRRWPDFFPPADVPYPSAQSCPALDNPTASSSSWGDLAHSRLLCYRILADFLPVSRSVRTSSGPLCGTALVVLGSSVRQRDAVLQGDQRVFTPTLHTRECVWGGSLARRRTNLTPGRWPHSYLAMITVGNDDK